MSHVTRMVSAIDEKVVLKTEECDEVQDIKIRICVICQSPINDQFLLTINDIYCHESCLQCCLCGIKLNHACYYKDGRMFCKVDYIRMHGCKCCGCECPISPNELVMKALQNVYHVDCFKCEECGDKLEKGDEFVLKNNKLYCIDDFRILNEKMMDVDASSSDEYDSSVSTKSSTSSSGIEKLRNTSSKRPRTILTSQQREEFKAAFEITPKPCRKVREKLSKETGLSIRVVQVWFQNQRAKLKKIQRKTESGVVGSFDKLKRTPNLMIENKKKRTKSNISSKSCDGGSLSDYHVTLSQTSIPSNSIYHNQMEIDDNCSSFMPYLTTNDSSDISKISHEDILVMDSNNNNTTEENDFIFDSTQDITRFPGDGLTTNKSPLSTFSQIQINLLENTSPNVYLSMSDVMKSTMMDNGQHQFNLMPHLMNSFS